MSEQIPDHVRGHWPQPDYEPWYDETHPAGTHKPDGCAVCIMARVVRDKLNRGEPVSDQLLTAIDNLLPGWRDEK
jgi:hypothetical protein